MDLRRPPREIFSSSLIVILAAALISGVGCASSQDVRSENFRLPHNIMPEDRIPTGPGAVRTHDGLVRVNAPETRAKIYVKPPRPHLQRFNAMILKPIQLSYRRGVKGLPEHHEEYLRARFRKMLLASINSGPAWTLTDSPGEGVLEVRVGVLDIDISRGDRLSSTSNVSFRREAGGAILVIELLDSVDQEPLFRWIERRPLPSGRFSGRNIERHRLVLTFDRLADDLGANLRTHYAIVREVERRELERAQASGRRLAAGN